jgi:hypothetical protein
LLYKALGAMVNAGAFLVHAEELVAFVVALLILE